MSKKIKGYSEYEVRSGGSYIDSKPTSGRSVVVERVNRVVANSSASKNERGDAFVNRKLRGSRQKLPGNTHGCD